MPKLNHKYYYTSTGERKINCYTISITREDINKAGFNDNMQLKVTAEKNRLIVEKANV